MYECHFFSTHAREDRRIVAEDQTKTSIVHLRTLSDNTPHPKAVNHTLHIPSYFSFPKIYSGTVVIMDNLIGIKMIAQMVIWDWTAARIVAVRSQVYPMVFV
jgi:hypothetical protein